MNDQCEICRDDVPPNADPYIDHNGEMHTICNRNQCLRSIQDRDALDHATSKQGLKL